MSDLRVWLLSGFNRIQTEEKGRKKAGRTLVQTLWSVVVQRESLPSRDTKELGEKTKNFVRQQRWWDVSKPITTSQWVSYSRSSNAQAHPRKQVRSWWALQAHRLQGTRGHLQLPSNNPLTPLSILLTFKAWSKNKVGRSETGSWMYWMSFLYFTYENNMEQNTI